MKGICSLESSEENLRPITNRITTPLSSSFLKASPANAWKNNCQIVGDYEKSMPYKDLMNLNICLILLENLDNQTK